MILRNGYQIPDICMGTDIMFTRYCDDNKIKEFAQRRYLQLRSMVRHDGKWKKTVGIKKVVKYASRGGVSLPR